MPLELRTVCGKFAEGELSSSLHQANVADSHLMVLHPTDDFHDICQRKRADFCSTSKSDAYTLSSLTNELDLDRILHPFNMGGDVSHLCPNLR